MSFLVCTLVTGIGATAVMDLWGLARRPLLGVPAPDYGLVGRWLAHMAVGRFRHESIARATSVRGEGPLGWAAHYLIGIAFAASLIATWGLEWVRNPTIGPAMVVGIVTVVAPLLLMQPGMGLGIAATRAPRPGAARLQSLLTHASFGIGLYAAGWAAHFLCRP